MEIKLVGVGKPNAATSEPKSQVVMLQVSGEGDFSNPVVQRAREMIIKNGSDAMLKSFDKALEKKTFFASK